MQGKITEYPLIGNDIVDLTHPDALYIHPRFSDRICTGAEYEQLNGFPKGSPDWLNRIWTFWSIKEAAYKAVKGFDPGLKFRWKDFDAAIEPGKVRCPYGISLTVYTNAPDRSLATQYYIHTIVFNPYSTKTSMHSLVDAIASIKADASDEIRKLFIKNILPQFNVSPDRVNWSRHISGAPVCSVNGNDLPFIISFGHHGRYMAIVLVAAGSR